MGRNKELLGLIQKDVISVLVNLIDDRNDNYILQTTDHYLLEMECEFKAIAVGYKIKYLRNEYEVAQLNFEFMGGGLTDTPLPSESFQGKFSPYSAILNVYVKKLG